MELMELGWNPFFAEALKACQGKGLVPARVIRQQKNDSLLMGNDGVTHGRVSGRLLHNAAVKKDLPAVGDWVAVQWMDGGQQSTICEVLPRKTCFVRKQPISGGRKLRNGIIQGGSTEEQVIAANIDTVFIVAGLDDNFNLHRIERYVTLAYNSGATPVILLNKADLCECVEDYRDKVKTVALALEVHAVSAAEGSGLQSLGRYLLPGRTVVFLGSSGVGKSSLINRLLGEDRLKVNTVSDANGKGRHTTTRAELLLHPSGYMVMDTPGLRELQLWCDEQAVEDSFEEITRFLNRCRFSDCRHDSEPGCAIRQAIADRTISAERFESYRAQQEELLRLGRRKRQFAVWQGRKEKKALMEYAERTRNQ